MNAQILLLNFVQFDPRQFQPSSLRTNDQQKSRSMAGKDSAMPHESLVGVIASSKTTWLIMLSCRSH